MSKKEECFKERVRSVFNNHSKITLTIDLLDLGEVEGEHLLNSLSFLKKNGMLGRIDWEYETQKRAIPKDMSESIAEQIQKAKIKNAIEADTPVTMRVIEMLRSQFYDHPDLAFGVINMVLKNEEVSHLFHWLIFNTNLPAEDIAQTVLEEYYADL